MIRDLSEGDVVKHQGKDTCYGSTLSDWRRYLETVRRYTRKAGCWKLYLSWKSNCTEVYKQVGSEYLGSSAVWIERSPGISFLLNAASNYKLFSMCEEYYERIVGNKSPNGIAIGRMLRAALAIKLRANFVEVVEVVDASLVSYVLAADYVEGANCSEELFVDKVITEIKILYGEDYAKLLVWAITGDADE